MVFKILNDVKFRFRGIKSTVAHNLISTITARKILRRVCQGYLAMVRDTKVDKKVVENVPVVCKFSNIFPKKLLGLPPKREIKLCIDIIPDTDPISMPPYRMVPKELKELKE